MKTKEPQIDIFELLGIPGLPSKQSKNICDGATDELHKAASQHLQQLSAYEKIRDDCTAQIAEIHKTRDIAIQLIDMAVSLGSLLKIPLKHSASINTATISQNKHTAEETSEQLSVENIAHASVMCGSRAREILNVFYEANTKDPGSTIMHPFDVAKKIGKSRSHVSVWLSEIKKLGAESPFERIYTETLRPGYKLSAYGIKLAKMFADEQEQKDATARVVYKMEDGLVTRTQVRECGHLVGGKTHKILSLFKKQNPVNPEKARLYEQDILDAHNINNSSDTYFSSWMGSLKKKGQVLVIRDAFAIPSRGRHSKSRPYKLTTEGIGMLMVLETLEKKQNEK